MAQRFAIIGLGTFGTRLALALTEKGAEVVAIDLDREEVEDIKDHVAVAMILDATDEDAVRALGLEKVEAVIVSVGAKLDQAILILATLQQVGVKRIIVKVRSKLERRIVKRLGAVEGIIPEEDAGLRLAQRLMLHGVLEASQIAKGYSIVTFKAPPAFYGKAVRDLRLREDHKVNLVTIFEEDAETPSHFGRCTGLPSPDQIIKAHDVLCIFGKDVDVRNLVS
ncbi:MAG: TrkA family potassium uptake protein [Candidatus Methylacidiphilales bacterium]